MSGAGHSPRQDTPLPRANYLCYIRAAQEDALEVSPKLLELLVCPVCKTPVKLTPDGQGLRCANCRLVYPIRDGFPLMIKDEAISEAHPESPKS